MQNMFFIWNMFVIFLRTIQFKLYFYFSFTFNAWVNIPFVNHLSHGPILALEDVNISFFLSFFLSFSHRHMYISIYYVTQNYVLYFFNLRSLTKAIIQDACCHNHVFQRLFNVIPYIKEVLCLNANIWCNLKHTKIQQTTCVHIVVICDTQDELSIHRKTRVK